MVLRIKLSTLGSSTFHSASSAILRDLTPGTRIWVGVRAIGRHGSDPATRYVT